MNPSREVAARIAELEAQNEQLKIELGKFLMYPHPKELQDQLAAAVKRVKQLETIGLCPKCHCIVVGHTTCDKCGTEAEQFIPGHEVLRLDMQLACSADKALRLEARINNLTSERDEWRFRAETAEVQLAFATQREHPNPIGISIQPKEQVSPMVEQKWAHEVDDLYRDDQSKKQEGKCETCEGSGWVWPHQVGDHETDQRYTCPVCGGNKTIQADNDQPQQEGDPS